MQNIALWARGRTFGFDKLSPYASSRRDFSPVFVVRKPCAKQLTSADYKTNEKTRGGWSSYRSWRQFVFPALFGSGVALFVARHKVYCEEETQKSVQKWKDMSITIYQYQTCPFCSKTRSFFLAYDIPFKSVEVHPIFKKEIKFSQYKKVPIVTIEKDGKIEQLNDSSLILSVLASFLVNDDLTIAQLLQQYPQTEFIDDDGKTRTKILNKHWLIMEETEVTEPNLVDARSEEAQWRAWADDYLVHLISPNVYRTLGEALQAFDYHVKQGRFNGTWEGVVAKYGGAVAMWAIGKRLKKKYNISENVRIDLYKACNKWVDAIGKDRKFMGGDKPNLADISVFGYLSVMENLNSFDDVLTHSKLKKWYFATKKAIEEHNGQSLQAK